MAGNSNSWASFEDFIGLATKSLDSFNDMHLHFASVQGARNFMFLFRAQPEKSRQNLSFRVRIIFNLRFFDDVFESLLSV